MTRDEIETLVSRRADAMNRHDAAALGRFYADECVLESPSAGGTIAGARAIGEVTRAWMASFPDLKFTTDVIAIDGDRVAWMAIAEGTGAGEFMGIQATGRSVAVEGIDFVKLAPDGRCREHWGATDQGALMAQLGVTVPAQAGAADASAPAEAT